MDPLKSGLRQYQDLNLPLSYSSYGGVFPQNDNLFIPTGNTPTAINSTVYRNGRPRGRPRKIVEPEGGVNISDVKKNVKKVAKKVKPAVDFLAPMAIDAALSLGSQAVTPLLAETIGPAAPIVANIGKTVARKGIKSLTGYGEPKRNRGRPKKIIRESVDVGIYDGGAHVNISLVQMLGQLFNGLDTGTLSSIKSSVKEPLKDFMKNHADEVLNVGVPTVANLLSEQFKNKKIGQAFSQIVNQFVRSQVGGAKPKKTRKSPSGNDKRRARGQLIKKIMKEKGMNLAQASKHIKENKLI